MSSLRLLAQDEEDLKIISAHLQDAVLRVGDLAYLPKQHRFAMLLNRFCWEDCGEAGAGARVLAGLHFDGVLKVQAHSLRPDKPDAVAELLAINFTPGSDGGGMIDLVLAGGGRIRLSVECIDAVLRDMTEPRPAVARPEHDLERS
jgi:hypothetical protein